MHIIFLSHALFFTLLLLNLWPFPHAHRHPLQRGAHPDEIAKLAKLRLSLCLFSFSFFSPSFPSTLPFSFSLFSALLPALDALGFFKWWWQPLQDSSLVLPSSHSHLKVQPLGEHLELFLWPAAIGICFLTRRDDSTLETFAKNFMPGDFLSQDAQEVPFSEPWVETRGMWVSRGSVRRQGLSSRNCCLEFWNVRPGWDLRDGSSNTVVLTLSDPMTPSHAQYFQCPFVLE